MPDPEPRTPYTFGHDDPEPPDDGGETPAERAERYRALGRRLSLGGLLLVLAVTAGMAVYVYRPAPVVELLRGTPLELAPRLTRAYKWRDAGGTWQLTGEPPPAGVEYEVIETRGVSVVPSLKAE